MTCRVFGGAIVCGPSRRRFTYKGRVYFIEVFGHCSAVWDEAKDCEVEYWTMSGKRLSKFCRELSKGAKGR